MREAPDQSNRHPASHPTSQVILLMGVCGSGKTTLGEALAATLNAPFLDGDQRHPPANVAKMAAGQPLNDADRAPWLAAVRKAIDTALAKGSSLVITCSALKRAYRQTLGLDRPGLTAVHLTADPATLRRRLETRSGHFMKPGMLDSQLATLEAPTAGGEPHIITVDVSGSLDHTLRELRKHVDG